MWQLQLDNIKQWKMSLTRPGVLSWTPKSHHQLSKIRSLQQQSTVESVALHVGVKMTYFAPFVGQQFNAEFISLDKHWPMRHQKSLAVLLWIQKINLHCESASNLHWESVHHAIWYVNLKKSLMWWHVNVCPTPGHPLSCQPAQRSGALQPQVLQSVRPTENVYSTLGLKMNIIWSFCRSLIWFASLHNG